MTHWRTHRCAQSRVANSEQHRLSTKLIQMGFPLPGACTATCAVRGLVPIAPVPSPAQRPRGRPPEGCPAPLSPGLRDAGAHVAQGRGLSPPPPGGWCPRAPRCPRVLQWQSRASGSSEQTPSLPSRRLAILCFSFNIYADSGVKSQPPLGLSGVWPVCHPHRQLALLATLPHRAHVLPERSRSCRVALPSSQALSPPSTGLRVPATAQVSGRWQGPALSLVGGGLARGPASEISSGEGVGRSPTCPQKQQRVLVDSSCNRKGAGMTWFVGDRPPRVQRYRKREQFAEGLAPSWPRRPGPRPHTWGP